MTTKYLLFLTLLLILQANCDSKVNSQTSQANANTAIVVKNPPPKDNPKISGDFELVKLDNVNEQTIRQQSAPRLFFNFRCSNDETDCVDNKRRQEIPAEVQALVADYWKTLLNYSYIRLTDNTVTLGDAERKRLDDDLKAKAYAFGESVEKLNISMPKENRSLLPYEVDEIFDVLNDEACHAVQQSDVCKVYDSEKKEWRIKEDQ